MADDCVTRTGGNATIVIPFNVAAGLESGDVVRARFKSLCVGQAVYQEGKAVALTVWGDDAMTRDVDGALEGQAFMLSVSRPSDGTTASGVDVSFEDGEAGTYRHDAILVAEHLQVEGAQSPAGLEAVAVEGMVASFYQAPNAPAHVTDGDPATRWSAEGDKQWLRLDLGQSRRLGAVDIAWFRGDERQAYFDVEVSADGQSWQQAFSGTSSGRMRAPERYALAAEGRFVRIVGHGNSRNGWNSITEVVLYQGTAEGASLAVAQVKASSDDGNVPANTVDSDPATRWSAEGDKQWLRLDLGQSRRLGAVDIAWFRGDERQAYFDVEVSADGQSWQQAFSGTSSGRMRAPERYALAAEGRFVRIVGHGNSRNGWNSISEIRLYGGDVLYAGTASKGATTTTALSSAKAAPEVPTSFELSQNYPNPFNPSTTIRYQLPEATKVTLTIYNAAGQRVRQLVDQHQRAGTYQARWDGRDATGVLVGSGMYVYQISAGTFRQTRTMVFVK